MTLRSIAFPAVVLIGVVAVGIGAAWNRPGLQRVPLHAAEVTDKPKAPEDNAKPKAPEDKGREADGEAVRETSKEFAKAFEKGDAKVVGSFWTEEGEYIAGDGTTLRGRAAIEEAYAKFFAKNPDLKLEKTIETIRFVSHDGAVEEGYARSYKGGKSAEPATSRFSALYARENGKWMLALLREWPDEGVALHDLDWLIGSWESKAGDRDVHTAYEWDEGKHFILAHFTIKNKDIAFSGTQLIGKDPRTGQLHSWLFESDGGFGEAVWNWDGKQWRLEANGVEADGGETSATNLLTPLDKDSFTWQSIDRTADGEEVPNIPPVKVVRVK